MTLLFSQHTWSCINNLCCCRSIKCYLLILRHYMLLIENNFWCFIFSASSVAEKKIRVRAGPVQDLQWQHCAAVIRTSGIHHGYKEKDYSIILYTDLNICKWRNLTQWKANFCKSDMPFYNMSAPSYNKSEHYLTDFSWENLILIHLE
jgi:hypothetical protein